jgi:outer membrane murein-binding lipoprotein Lpp
MAKKIFLAVAVVLFLAGCGTGKKINVLETKVDSLEGKINSVEGRQSSIETQAGDSRESIGYVKGKVDGMPKGPSTVVVTGSQGNNGGFSGKKRLTNKEIQTTLKDAGYYSGNIDGKLGKNTKKAIKEFQKANGLKVDGVAGDATMSMLSQYLK